mmetsp:Transcript_85837/g.277113  ORF Transcript_85837/g.277113 Transcript_85837/m.277113 type:complete len:727 (+) Transcript_85837:101-2281(+)
MTSLSFELGQAAPRHAALAGMRSAELQQRLATDVGNFVRHFGDALEAQLLQFHGALTADLERENELLRRLDGADEALQRLGGKDPACFTSFESTLAGLPYPGPVMHSSANPFNEFVQDDDEVPRAEDCTVPVARSEGAIADEADDDKVIVAPAEVTAAAEATRSSSIEWKAAPEQAGDDSLPTVLQASPKRVRISNALEPRTESRTIFQSENGASQEPERGEAEESNCKARATAIDDDAPEQVPEKKPKEESLDPTEYEEEGSNGDSHLDTKIDVDNYRPSRSSELYMRRWGTVATLGVEEERSVLHKIVSSNYFEGALAIIILLNCGQMGMDAHIQVAENPDPIFKEAMEVCDHIFTLVFLLEFLMKCRVFGCRYFSPFSPDADANRFNFMDACLVFCTGVLFTWVLPLVGILLHIDMKNQAVLTLGVLRIARLARLVRVANKIAIFKEAWILIRGLSDSMRTLFWTCIVICFVTYIFAIFGLLTIVTTLQEAYVAMVAMGDDDLELVGRREELKVVLSMISGMDELMFTLIQVLMGDSFNAITRPIMYHIPWTWLYFYAYIAVAVFVLMNLVTAIIVDNAMTSSRMDEDAAVKLKEFSKEKDLADLKKMFFLMDADGNGTLSWLEFRDSFEDTEMSKKWMLLDFQPAECKELFELLDDGDGEIDTEEFFEGLGRMKGIAQSKDIFRVQKVVNSLQGCLAEIREEFRQEKKSPRVPTTQRKKKEP